MTIEVVMRRPQSSEYNSARALIETVANETFKSRHLPNARTWKFASGQGADLSRLKTIIVFDYRLEGEPGIERCAARVIFDSFNKVEIIGHPPVMMTNDAQAKRP